MTTATTERLSGGLWIGVLGSELLLALSFVRLWGDANSAIFRTNKVIDATLDQPFWGTALSRHVAWFVAGLVLAHLVLGLTAWALGKLSRVAWPKSPNSARVWTLLWLVLLSVWILTANAAWFPASSIGGPYSAAVTAEWHGLSLFHIVTASITVPLAIMLGRIALARFRPIRKHTNWITGAVAGTAAVSALAAFGLSSFQHPSAEQGRPHVIVIGLDSLRPDALRGADGQDLAPALNAFLSESTVFSDTLTPLARTFPAWVSIVSGKHPHTTGAVINLLTRDLIDEGDTLPRLLRQGGYRTVYATDEVRFSNLDETYGFDEVVAPPMGAADFLLGFFSDTPLMNVVVNTTVGEWLFPNAYANRAVAVSYDPDTFIERLDSRLSFDEPTFLAVHLTLAHWPYNWAGIPLSENPEVSVARLYRQAVPRLDQQFGDLIEMLRARGALDNAIVVVLSDHGEALGEELPIERDPHAQRHIRALALNFGHGTNVFARAQYQVLLALRSFGTTGLTAPPGASRPVPASLEDIAPTLVEVLNLSPERPFDGISLLPQLAGEAVGDRAERIRFLETEFVPPGFEAGVTLSTSVLENASDYYRVDAETDRVYIRAERLDDVLESRQYAATLGNRLLAALPSDNKKKQHVVYLEHPTADPVWLRTAPVAGDPAFDLWAALHERFPLVRTRPIAAPLGDAN